ncbi:MAG TPA: hydrogenase maturation nickel metallochaperone HypA [Gammaproteobacteria bacterium]|nr:hydrogenase maturation nickel metallochaperone HypA [Gammaproteobacteria bacterium]
MHEISLCERVLQVLEEQAGVQRYRKVKTVWLEVGALAGVEVEALRFGFDVVMKDSIAAGARLEIIAVPGQAWCPQCGKKVAIRQRFDGCPGCGGHQLQVTAGEALRIRELEVE